MKKMRAIMENHPEFSGAFTEEKWKEVERKNPEEIYIRADLFTGAQAEKLLPWKRLWEWLFYSEIKKERRKKHRMAIYRKILEDCETETPKLLDVKIGNEYFFAHKGSNWEKYIGITGKGFVFSRWDSLMHELFFDKYKGWITLLVSLILAVLGSSYIVILKDWFITITAPYSPFW